MFKIGEFSRLTQVSVRMLRYYDEMGLLKPATMPLYFISCPQFNGTKSLGNR